MRMVHAHQHALTYTHTCAFAQTVILAGAVGCPPQSSPVSEGDSVWPQESSVAAQMLLQTRSA